MRSSKKGAGIKAAASLLLGTVCLVSSAFSQDKPASLEGSVTNSVTGEPLLRAHVAVRGTTAAGKQVRYGALTDASGKFSITSLPAGAYSAEAEHTGFASDVSALGPGGIQLGAGDQRTDIKLQLTPFGSVSGRVVGPDGEPVEWVHVSAEGANGEVGLNCSTDDHGVYRIGGLRPGRYRIKAAPQMTTLPPETRSDGTSESHFLATYHPNSAAAKGAARISVQAGSELTGIDIHLAQGPVVRVSGTVRDLPDSCKPLVEFRSGKTFFAVPRAKPDGTFSIWRIDPAAYTVAASCSIGGKLWRSAQLEIEAGTADVDHVDLRLLPPGDVAGRVQYDGNEVPPARRHLVLEDLDQRASVPLADIISDDTFKLESVAAGRYRIRVTPGPVYVKSVRIGPTTTEGSILDIRNGASGAAVTMVLSGALGSVAGSVTNDKGPAAGARVVLIPEDTDTGLNGTITAATPSGAYSFDGVRPGRYKLVALAPGDSRNLEELDDRVEHIEVNAHDQLLQDLTVPSEFQIGIRR